MKNYVLYDGDCGICSHSAVWLAQRLNLNFFEITPFDENSVISKKFDLNYDLASRTVILVKNGVIYTESRAIFEIAKSLNRFYKFFGYLFANDVITAFANPIYRLIAKNRALISRKLGLQSCKVRFDNDNY